MVKWTEQWAEAFTLIFVVLGFFLGVILVNPAFSYFSIFLAGGLTGRIFYMKRFKEPILPFVLIILGFLFGYLVGSVWASRFWILVLFAVGFGTSYYLHLKKILVIFKSENFIK